MNRESDFIVVQSKSRKHRKNKKSAKPASGRDSSPVEVDIDKLRRQIEIFERNLLFSEFYKSAVESIEVILQQKPVKEVICLGIGKISECLIAKHQLAFISEISRKFHLEISFFDPVLSEGDRKLLESLNHKVLTENKEGKYLAEHPTLFFLPHCPKQITNNLLFANWTAGDVKNLVLICNSFKSIIVSTPERFLRPNAHFLLEINPYIEEVEVKNNFQFTDIFNDFAIHWINDSTEIPQTLWDFRPTPNYQENDLELIPNGCTQDTPGNPA